LLIRAGTPFIATNPDRTFPTPEGLTPGAGTVVAAVQAATDIAPLFVGKPSPFMYQVALERLNIPAENTLVIGDRIDTDIVGGVALGCPTGLVLSGVTSQEQAERVEPHPDFIAPDLAEMIGRITDTRG
jgi:4-nitrophenyl phosphatase